MADTVSQPAAQRDLVFTRTFDAPIEEVWKAWTEAEYVQQWWGPDGFTAPVAEMDVREGGTSLVAMSSPQFGTNYSIWQYREVAPLQRLVYVHNLADKDGNAVDPAALGMPPDFPRDQLHVASFEALDDGRTEVTFTEHGWTEGQMMELSRMGMEQCLDKMAAIFARS
jgi:uncharacterized protein YndB with AHSA1/START domain